MSRKATANHRWGRRIAVTTLLVVALAFGGFALYASDYYRAGDEAQQLIAAGHDGAGAIVEESGSSIAVGDPAAEYGGGCRRSNEGCR